LVGQTKRNAHVVFDENNRDILWEFPDDLSDTLPFTR
jgi:hypothetical protein